MTAPDMSTGRVLVHAIDPARSPQSRDDVSLLPRAATLGAIADLLDGAAALVVDDALAFPFEALRQSDRDIPLIFRVPVPLDAHGLDAVLGADVLDHLTPFDFMAGPRAAVDGVLARRRLPVSRFVGNAETSLDELIERGFRGQQRVDRAWRPRPTDRATLLNALPPSPAADARGGRLRDLKTRLRSERDALRLALADVDRQQPATRGLRAAVVARRPTAWLSALPRHLESWTGISLAPDASEADDLPRQVGDIFAMPPSGRLPLEAAAFDVVVVAGQVLHAPRHALIRLFEECERLVRRGGWVVVLADVVVDERGGREERPRPLSTNDLLDLVGECTGRTVVLRGVRALRRPTDKRHRTGVFVFQSLRTNKVTSWT